MLTEKEMIVDVLIPQNTSQTPRHVVRWLRRVCGRLLVCLAAGTTTGYAEERAAVLNAVLNDWTRMEATFLQTVLDQSGEVFERSRGTVAIARPGRFYWHYEIPFSQLIVSNGGELHIYDEDLAQVTVGSLDGASDDPAASLLQSKINVDEVFTVDWMEADDADRPLEWVRLTPRQPGATYEYVEIGFQSTDLSIIKLIDNFAQTTVIEFFDVTRDADIDLSKFDFEPPAGVDVVRMDE